MDPASAETAAHEDTFRRVPQQTSTDQASRPTTSDSRTSNPNSTPASAATGPGQAALHQEKSNEREVTDPVTHLPLQIHDHTQHELNQIPPPPESPDQQGDDEDSRKEESGNRHKAMEALIETETKTNWGTRSDDQRKAKIGLVLWALLFAGVGNLLILFWVVRKAKSGLGVFDIMLTLLMSGMLSSAFVGGSTLYALQFFGDGGQELQPSETPEQVQSLDNEYQIPPSLQQQKPESAAWLNSFLASLWPIINPALFISLSDLLEDSIQSSLNVLKVIRGVRIADLGQGSEPLRVIGVRWLEPGDAGETKEGMQAEEGDFVNLEMALAYRARPVTGKNLKKRSTNAHLMIEFWSMGGVRLPVWVEVTGFLTLARVRVQLTPDPPFLQLMTLTLLGQPKVTVSCKPLNKNFLNIMDIPGLSHFLQSCIDQAVSTYVAPGSLNLDLKTTLMGSDMKTDTTAIGVVVVRVKSAHEFKEGDAAKAWIKSPEGKSGDPYVTVGWRKFGKAVWSTRIIQNEPKPMWDEMTMLLVGPQELNAQEALKLSLWDSDRQTADDLLGVVQVDLGKLMHDTNKINTREDRFMDDEGKEMPGTLYWEVGYFSKTTLDHHVSESLAKEVREKTKKEAKGKLRESTEYRNNDTGELGQVEKEQLKEASDRLIVARPPNADWPCGILEIQIKNITELAVENIRGSGVKNHIEEEDNDDLPSSYCNIIINEQAVYKTRTKLKSSKPFFNTGTQRFIRNWKTTVVMISVRDERIHEKDPILGVLVLPLRKLFAQTSQINQTLPIVGGIGSGRLAISMVFRSVQAQLPRNVLGWDIGTIEVQPKARIRQAQSFPQDLQGCTLSFKTPWDKGKMLHGNDSNSDTYLWHQKRGRPIRLGIINRYSACLVVEFRKHVLGPDRTAAFAILWLKDIADNEDTGVTLTIHRNVGGDALKRARLNATDSLGERIGALDLDVKFRPGMSGYHTKLTSKDSTLSDVMETLSAAEDSNVKDATDELDGAGSLNLSDGSTSSESSSDEEEEQKLRNDGDRGLRDELKEMKRNRKDLHRKHRGLMQWKGTRSLAWFKDEVEEKGEDVKDRIKKHWQHGQRESKVDTEA